MSTSYRPGRQTAPSSDSPGWILLKGVVLLAACIVALPAGITGLVAQKLIPRFDQEKWNFFIWFVLSGACIYYFYRYQSTITNAIAQELVDYFLSLRHHWLDFPHWNWKALWAVTEPMWLRTILAFPLVAMWQELTITLKPGQTSRLLKKQERRRQRRNARYQQRARRQVSMPELVPDEVNGIMIIGVPIKEEEEE